MIRNFMLLSFLLLSTFAIAENPKAKPKADADKTKKELITELKATRASEKRLADLIEKVAEKLGGEARLEVTPKDLRDAKPDDVKKLLKGVNTYMDPGAEIDIYRKQIKTVEEQLAKALDQLDAEKATNAKLCQQIKELKAQKK